MQSYSYVRCGEQPQTAPAFLLPSTGSFHLRGWLQTSTDVAQGAAIKLALSTGQPPNIRGGGDHMENLANNLELAFKEREKTREPEEKVCFEPWHVNPVEKPLRVRFQEMFRRV